MNTVTTIDSGTVSSEMTASNGLIQNMIAITPMIVQTAVISWVMRLLERVGDVVDVVGDAAQRVAARMAVEVAQRHPRQLLVDVAAHPVDGPL